MVNSPAPRYLRSLGDFVGQGGAFAADPGADTQAGRGHSLFVPFGKPFGNYPAIQRRCWKIIDRLWIFGAQPKMDKVPDTKLTPANVACLGGSQEGHFVRALGVMAVYQGKSS